MINGLPCLTPIPRLGTAFPRRETTPLRDDDDVEGIGVEEMIHEDVVVGMGVIGGVGGLLNSAAHSTKDSASLLSS